MAADLKIKIKGDASSLKNAVGQSKTSIGGLKRSMSSIMAGPAGMAFAAAAVGIGLIATAASAAFNHLTGLATKLDDIAKASKRSGVNAQEFQFLAYAARRTGVDMATVEKSMRRMVKVIADAGRGLSTSKDALAALGLGFKDLNGLSIEEQFTKVAGRLALVGDESKQVAIGLELFGSRGGTAMKELIKQMEPLREQFKELGGVIEDDALAAAEQFKDELEDVNTQFTALVANSGALRVLANAFRDLNDVVAQLKKDLKELGTMPILKFVAGVASGQPGAAWSGLLKDMESATTAPATVTAEETKKAVELARAKRALAVIVNEAAGKYKPEKGIGGTSIAALGGGGTLASLGGDISGGGFSARMSIPQQQLDVLNKILEANQAYLDATAEIRAQGNADYWIGEIKNTFKD